MAEKAGRKAVCGGDQTGVIRRIGKLRLDDCSESQIAERSTALPALVAAFGDDHLRPGAGAKVGECLQPVNAGQPVPVLAVALGVEEVARERRRVVLAEPERGDPGANLVGAQDERTGSGLTMPTPRSRFVVAIASAMRMIS